MQYDNGSFIQLSLNEGNSADLFVLNESSTK